MGSWEVEQNNIFKEGKNPEPEIGRRGAGPSQTTMRKNFTLRVVLILTVILLSCGVSFARSTTRYSRREKAVIHESPSVQRRMSRLRHSRRVTRSAAHRRASRRHHYYGERFYTSSFAENLTTGDTTVGEDPVVRAAAVDALGNMNGTILAIDPTSGRILTMVNRNLALSGGAQPCSTIKLSVALAALTEGIVSKETEVSLGGRWHMNMTNALAHSNNAYFESLGRQLGFEKVHYYAHQFGLGELAGYNIAGEHLGVYPDTELPMQLGGVGKMCSFGESISMTPLQLGALVSAIANGGNLFYLQHPESAEEVADFRPQIKRHLDIGALVPEMSDGMMGAVRYGTAHSLRHNFSAEQVMGKTGTCSKDGTRFGWFASYANTEHGKIVTVVFLRGGRPTFGPKAAELTGRLYRNLYEHSYFAASYVTSLHNPAAQSLGVAQ